MFSNTYSQNKSSSEAVKLFWNTVICSWKWGKNTLILQKIMNNNKKKKEHFKRIMNPQWMEAYVWAKLGGCQKQSASYGCRGSWVPPGERWSPSCRSRCCLQSQRRGWCLNWGCWGGHRSLGRAIRVPWRRSPWWCWAPRTAEVWERCLEADRAQNALPSQKMETG